MKRTVVAAMLGGLLFAGCGRPQAGQAKLEPRVIPCHRAKGKITIDGHVDDPAWKLAHFIDDFRVPGSGAKPQAATSARLLWDDEFLYLAVVMEDSDVYGFHKAHDANTWEDDVCELFLKPSETKHPYFEIHVTPLGTTLDLLIARRGAGSFHRWAAWESGMQAKATVKGTVNDWSDKDQGWIVEAAIPLKAFEPASQRPKLGDRWRFAVCRYNYSVHLDKGIEHSSSAALDQLNFHRFEAYDTLEFTD